MDLSPQQSAPEGAPGGLWALGVHVEEHGAFGLSLMFMACWGACD